MTDAAPSAPSQRINDDHELRQSEIAEGFGRMIPFDSFDLLSPLRFCSARSDWFTNGRINQSFIFNAERWSGILKMLSQKSKKASTTTQNQRWGKQSVWFCHKFSLKLIDNEIPIICHENAQNAQNEPTPPCLPAKTFSKLSPRTSSTFLSPIPDGKLVGWWWIKGSFLCTEMITI